MITLSPDGQRIAYLTQTGDDRRIVLLNLEPPLPKRTVKIDPERDPAVADHRPPTPLRFLRWGPPTRLIYAPVERVVPRPPVTDKDGRTAPNPDGPTILSPILGVDIDGKQRGTIVDAANFQETPADARRSLADLLRTTKELQATRSESVRWRMPHLDILGFLPRDREQLVIQTRGAYSVPSQHLVDIRTGSIREFGGDWPTPPGEPHVFDWVRLKVVGEHQQAARPATAWRDEEFGRVQRELELKFPRRTVEILDWSETRSRVLCRVTGGTDAGRFFVYQRTENLALEILRLAPWLNAAKLHETRFFEFDAPSGVHLSGYLTWPRRAPESAPPPLMIVFPTGFPGCAQPAFDPEAQLLADFGFVVARLNHRSVAGVQPADVNALRVGVDRLSIDDARAAIDWIAARHPQRPFDPKRIATLGRGFGGYLAVRALQLHPTVFRCGVAIDAPMELGAWLHADAPGTPPAKIARGIPVTLFTHEGADWKNFSVVEHAAALTNPVLLLVEPTRDPAIDACTETLCARLKSAGRAPERVDLEPGFATARAASRAAVYRKIEEFLAASLQPFAVKIGTPKEVN